MYIYIYILIGAVLRLYMVSLCPPLSPHCPMTPTSGSEAALEGSENHGREVPGEQLCGGAALWRSSPATCWREKLCSHNWCREKVCSELLFQKDQTCWRWSSFPCGRARAGKRPAWYIAAAQWVKDKRLRGLRVVWKAPPDSASFPTCVRPCCKHPPFEQQVKLLLFLSSRKQTTMRLHTASHQLQPGDSGAVYTNVGFQVE